MVNNSNVKQAGFMKNENKTCTKKKRKIEKGYKMKKFNETYVYIEVCERVVQAINGGKVEELGGVLSGLTRSNIINVLCGVAGAGVLVEKKKRK